MRHLEHLIGPQRSERSLLIGNGSILTFSAAPAQDLAEGTFFSSLVIRGTDAGNHTTRGHSLLTIEHRPVGSGLNGPASSDVGLTISIVKKALDTTTVVGELDGLTVYVRNAGAGSDAAAYLANIAHVGTGVSLMFEGVNQKITLPATVNQQLRCQYGIIDTINSIFIGYYAEAEIGALGAAYQADNEVGSSWAYFFRGMQGGTNRFLVNSAGNIESIVSHAVSNAPSLTLEQTSTGTSMLRFLLTGVRAWDFGIDNADNDALKLAPGSTANWADAVMRFDTGGLITALVGSFNGPGYQVNTTPVVGTRKTGYTNPMTGTANRATSYATGTITLIQLAERVKAIQDDITTHGLIGA
jgi:hypothetical protein